MAVPKRKLSRSRTRHRKAQWYKMQPPTLTECPRCKSPKRPHRVCAECGQYQGRTAVEVD